VVVTIVEQPPGVRRVICAGLAALRCGPSNGEIAVLLPGYTGSKEDYAPILPHLAEAGYTAVAFDQRGQFESAPVNEDADIPDDGEAAGRYTIVSLAADVHRVADELERPVHLVGHSFGGLVARAALVGRPEIAASLTLLGSGPAGIVGPRRTSLKAMRGVYARGGRTAVWRAIQAADSAVYPPGMAEFNERRFFASSEVALRVMGRELLEEPDRVGEVAAVAARHGVPMLVAHGAGDDAWPPAVQADMARRLGARYEVVPGALHSPAAQNPAGTAAVLVSFLRDVTRARAA
jgi:pimeloyl-ACP methyl ester carboxylesterase